MPATRDVTVVFRATRRVPLNSTDVQKYRGILNNVFSPRPFFTVPDDTLHLQTKVQSHVFPFGSQTYTSLRARDTASQKILANTAGVRQRNAPGGIPSIKLNKMGKY